MRRLIRIILAAGIFLGGYYLGRLPDSPDLIGKGLSAYRQVARTTRDISAKADREDLSVPKAALAHLMGSVEAERLPSPLRYPPTER